MSQKAKNGSDRATYGCCETRNENHPNSVDIRIRSVISVGPLQSCIKNVPGSMCTISMAQAKDEAMDERKPMM